MLAVMGRNVMVMWLSWVIGAVSLSYDAQGGLVGYGTVKIYNSNVANTANNGYEIHLAVTPSIQNESAPSIPNYNNGLLLSIKYMDKWDRPIKETKFDYDLERTLHVFYGVKPTERVLTIYFTHPYCVYPLASKQIFKNV